MLKRLILLPAILAPFGCFPETALPPTEKSATPPALTSPAHTTAADDSFSDLQALCGALEQLGLRTHPWIYDGLEWGCSSDYKDIGTAFGGTVASNLAYYVMGDTPERAYGAKLVLNVNDRNTKFEGLRQLARAARELVKSTNRTLPLEVFEAAETGRQLRRTEKGVTYAVEMELTRIETFRFVLLDAKAAVAKEKAQAAAIRSSVEVFAACKHAIARDLSYPESALSGDGEPIQEQGYQSFLISGNPRDIFFCEVYPNGTYKISASLAGQYPFKDVASGSFEAAN